MTRATPKPAPVAPDAADARLAEAIVARLFLVTEDSCATELIIQHKGDYLGEWRQEAAARAILRELTAARASAPARGTRRGRNVNSGGAGAEAGTRSARAVAQITKGRRQK